MAIYSCNLASIGRTTHAAGTAGCHLAYVGRPGAEPYVEAHVIPAGPLEGRAWMDREEARDRKNARVADKIRIAIPRELDRDQRAQLVRDFCRDLTQDRVPWLFAIHQDGEDRHNPHAHIVVRDRDLETGKRFLRLSDSARDRKAAGLEPKAVEWVRIKWEASANRALERAGHEARIDRRTLEAQGIERNPTIHIGPRADHVESFVTRPASKVKTNALGREIDYPAIDQGRTRRERNAEIVDLNLERDARSPDAATRLQAKFEREQIRIDRRLEKELAEQARKRTAELRTLKADFRREFDALREQRRTAYQEAVTREREALAPRVVAMRTGQAQRRHALKAKQQTLWSRVKRTLDVTGATRERHQKERRTLIATMKKERHDLAAETRATWIALKDANAKRFAPEEERLVTQRANALTAVREMHRRGEAMADAKRQLREVAREQARDSVQLAVQAHEGRQAASSGRPHEAAAPYPVEPFGFVKDTAGHSPDAQPRLPAGRRDKGFSPDF